MAASEASPELSSQPWVDRLAFKAEHTQGAFMHLPQWPTFDKAMEPLKPEPELAFGQ